LNVTSLTGSPSLFTIFAGLSTSIETKRFYHTEFNGDRSGSLGTITINASKLHENTFIYYSKGHLTL